MPANNATDGVGAPSDSEHAAATVVRAAVAIYSTEEGMAAEVVDAGGGGGQEAAAGDITDEALLEKLKLLQYHEKLISVRATRR
jgi:hypothetical protein